MSRQFPANSLGMQAGYQRSFAYACHSFMPRRGMNGDYSHGFMDLPAAAARRRWRAGLSGRDCLLTRAHHGGAALRWR